MYACMYIYIYIYIYGHSSLTDILVQVIDYTDTKDPTARESFWIYKLNCFAPLGFNSMDI